MKNIQAQYQDLLEGRMSKANFMRNLRMQFPQHISPVTSYDDSVKILKGKRILSEAKKPEGVYGHNPNAEMDEYRKIDHLNYYQVYHGIQFELAKMPEITDEAYIRARKKVVDKILKDPDAYRDLQLANFKAVKEIDKDLEMKEVKKDSYTDKPNRMKIVRKDNKSNTQDNLGKKEAKKSKTAKIPVMTQTPKGKLETFATPGKEKTIKEGLKGRFDSDDNIYTYDHLIKTDSPNKEQLEKVKAAIKADKEELAQKDKKAENPEAVNEAAKINTTDKFDVIKRNGERIKGVKFIDIKTYVLNGVEKSLNDNDSVEKSTVNEIKDEDNSNESKVQALKEHILDEMTNINPAHEDMGKGARVKKKDGAEAGEVLEFDGHTATVKWDDGRVEDVQKNVLTKKDVPNPQAKPSENPFSKMPDLGGSGQSWLNKQIKEDPVGQQAADDPEEEASLKSTLIKKTKEEKLKTLKEKLLKALKKESGDVVKAQDGTVLAVTPSGQGQTAARSIKTQSKGGINPVVSTVRS